MSLSFDDVSWDLVTSTDDEVLDSFCLEFDTTSEDGRHLAQQLQVFSPQVIKLHLDYCDLERECYEKDGGSETCDPQILFTMII